MKTDLLPDEIYLTDREISFFQEDPKWKGTHKYIRADLVSTPTKSAEVDLDALKRKCEQHLMDIMIIGAPLIDCAAVLIDYLHSSGHLATGKGWSE